MMEKQMNIMVFTDNKFMYNNFTNIIHTKGLNKVHKFTFACSISNKIFMKDAVEQIRIVDIVDNLIDEFDLIISCHSKQIFPKKLVDSIRCINIHPGFNPYNRGWYPQVFSIINQKPLGVTIHEMDEEIDHGNIIVQRKIELYDWDTSLSAYNKILNLEIELLNEYLENIIYGTYQTQPMENEGNYNSKQDFNDLCELNLEEKMTVKAMIDRLRALTHGEHSNAFFFDDKNNKIFLKISLHKNTIN